MNIFGPGMWGGLRGATQTYLTQANLMENQREKQRQFDEQLKLRQAQEARLQSQFETQQDMQDARNVFGKAILTGTVPSLMDDLKEYSAGSGPLADINPDVQALAQAMPTGMIKGYLAGEYMPYEDKVMQELALYNAKHPQTPSVSLKDFVGPDGPGLYAIDKNSMKMQKLGNSIPKGMSITYNKETGDFEVSTGGSGKSSYGDDLRKPSAKSRSLLQQGLIDTSKELDLTEVLLQNFDPKYFRWPERLGWEGLKVFDKFSDLPPKYKDSLGKYSQYTTKALGNLNEIIHKLSGAAVSVQEEGRLKGGIPDIGDTWWKGDSPTVFSNKLKATLQLARMAQARYNYFIKNGFVDPKQDPKKVRDQVTALSSNFPLESMGPLIKAKTKEFLKELMAQSPGTSPEVLFPEARARAADYFGVRL